MQRALCLPGLGDEYLSTVFSWEGQPANTAECWDFSTEDDNNRDPRAYYAMLWEHDYDAYSSTLPPPVLRKVHPDFMRTRGWDGFKNAFNIPYLEREGSTYTRPAALTDLFSLERMAMVHRELRAARLPDCLPRSL